MALIDLGYVFPLSTGNPNYSPDGIYGDETASLVKQFQKHSRPLPQDGVVGRHTMEELDRRFVAPPHPVRLHFRSLALANASFEQSLRNAVPVFGQYGIKVIFASGESLQLTPATDQGLRENRAVLRLDNNGWRIACSSRRRFSCSFDGHSRLLRQGLFF